jgi:hypothetical protein
MPKRDLLSDGFSLKELLAEKQWLEAIIEAAAPAKAALKDLNNYIAHKALVHDDEWTDGVLRERGLLVEDSGHPNTHGTNKKEADRTPCLAEIDGVQCSRPTAKQGMIKHVESHRLSKRVTQDILAKMEANLGLGDAA